MRTFAFWVDPITLNSLILLNLFATGLKNGLLKSVALIFSELNNRANINDTLKVIVKS